MSSPGQNSPLSAMVDDERSRSPPISRNPSSFITNDASEPDCTPGQASEDGTMSAKIPEKSGPLQLSTSNLGLLNDQGLVQIPTYSRDIDADRNLIYHLGVGGFHRSHQAVYLNDLLSRGENWGLVGVGILPFDLKMYEALKSQDYLYTVMSRGSTGFGCTVVGSILDFVYAPDDVQGAVERMASEQCKIVSLTITEKGYCWDTEGHMDKENPLVKRDLADITAPASALGFIVSALKLRKERSMKPFTVLSCDNIPENGHITKRLTLELAELIDSDLAAWIREHVPFPMTMVDRITPLTTEVEQRELADQYGICDAWPVVAEDFMQWVIEDKFVDDLRPNWEHVGALIVNNVTVYESMKIRVLNGGHSAISCVGYLLGHRDVHVAMMDSRISNFLRSYFSEVSVTVPPVPGVDLEQYQSQLINRFGNVHIKDKLQRLAEDGSMKLLNTMRGPIVELLEMKKPVEIVALSIASFARYMMGTDEQGQPIVLKDPKAKELHPLVWEIFCNNDSSKNFIATVFGEDVVQNGLLTEAVDRWISIIKLAGMASALNVLLPEDHSAMEGMKQKVLQGGLTAIACLGYLLGHRDVSSAISDDRLLYFLRAYFSEVLVTVPDVDMEEYKMSLLAQFKSVHVRDKLERVAQNGSMKLFNAMRGPIMELLEMGESVDMIAFAVASFSRYMMGADEHGVTIIIKDPLTSTLYPLVWTMYCGNSSSKKMIETLFGAEVGDKAEFVAAVDEWVSEIKSGGVEAALRMVPDRWKGSEIGDELSEIGDLNMEIGALKLSTRYLEAIGDAGMVSVPTYNRDIADKTSLIYHFGVGGFHRSHQAFYLHDLLSMGKASDWALVGVGILPFDKAMYDALKSQNYLYSLMSRGSSGVGCSVVGSIMDYVYAPNDKKACVELLAEERCKIVSLTITEKGYCWKADGSLDVNNDLIAADIVNIAAPSSALGYIVSGLKLRKERGMKPFTVLSCDNIPENGHVAKRLVLELAATIDKELAEWISTNVPFPATMVDRITPLTTAHDREQLAEFYLIDDAWPVVAEDFMQWVIEDNFVDDCRPQWEQVGAMVVEDVTSYEAMKIRLLNGGHSAIACLSYLLGHREVDKAMTDPRVSGFLWAYFGEVVGTVPEVPGVDLEQYMHKLVGRFSNVHIRDTLQRLAEDGSMKLYNTMRGPIMDRLSEGKSVDIIALAVTAYMRYMMGADELGQPITIKDPLAAKLHPLVWKVYCANKSCKQFLMTVFGSDVAGDERFVKAVDRWVNVTKDEDLAAAIDQATKKMESTEEMLDPTPPGLVNSITSNDNEGNGSAGAGGGGSNAGGNSTRSPRMSFDT